MGVMLIFGKHSFIIFAIQFHPSIQHKSGLEKVESKSIILHLHSLNQQKMSSVFKFLLATILLTFLTDFINGQPPAAWPATSYSPYFQSMFSQASAPVAALPSGAGAQAPAIPVGGGGSPGGPGPGPAFGPPGRK